MINHFYKTFDNTFKALNIGKWYSNLFQALAEQSMKEYAKRTKSAKNRVTSMEEELAEANKKAVDAAKHALELQGAIIDPAVKEDEETQSKYAADSIPSRLSEKSRSDVSGTTSEGRSRISSKKIEKRSFYKSKTSVSKKSSKLKNEESNLSDDDESSVLSEPHEQSELDAQQENEDVSKVPPLEELMGKEELNDEDFWSNIHSDQLEATFLHYRGLAKKKIFDLEEEIAVTLSKAQNKLSAVKQQFQEHKTKWAEEKEELLTQLKQREHQADTAMNQLEDFIQSQEDLDKIEKEKLESISGDQGMIETSDRDEGQLEQEKLLEMTDDAKLSKSVQALDTVESVRRNSAKSRSSLREEHKQKLDELKSSSEVGFEDKSSSPMHSFVKADHPVAVEFMKLYKTVLDFKEQLSKIFMDKEMNSAGQILNDMESVELKNEHELLPQLEHCTANVFFVLTQCTSLLSQLLSNDRDYAVSSTVFSRDATQMTGGEEAKQNAKANQTRVTSSGRSIRSATRTPVDPTLIQQLKDLKIQYDILQNAVDNDHKKHSEEIQHNTVVMMEMQDTINNLQRELSLLSRGKQNSAIQFQNRIMQSPPVMFTRLDSERNARSLKKAVIEKRLEPERYEAAVMQMETYVNIPAQRFVNLVHKYVQHRKMRQIEDNVRKSNSLNADVFVALDKMESLQSLRAQRWTERMDILSENRLKMASSLMDTFADIEDETGIFLIKPVYSYTGSHNPDKYHGKLSRAYRAPQTSHRESNLESTKPRDPVPSPASRIRTAHRIKSAYSTENELLNDVGLNEEYDETTLLDGQTPVWNPMSSTAAMGESTGLSSLTTPKILEMDVNRMIIGQHQISMKLDEKGSKRGVRTYMTINRPVASNQSITSNDENSSKHQKPITSNALLSSESPSVRLDRAHALPPITPRSSQSQGPEGLPLAHSNSSDLNPPVPRPTSAIDIYIQT